jgi:GT2 family glycosyltransferase
MSITAVITSCGRFDFLETTLESLVQYADSPFDKIIVVDNSTDPATERYIEEISKRIQTPIHLLANSTNIGQIASIDLAYSYVDTEYIFHCEDDWQFFDTGFLELSKKLLEERPNITNVNLRVRFDGEKGSMHPITDIIETTTGVRYHEYVPNYLDAWHGFAWNPGLRRTKDYNLIKPFKQYGCESVVGAKYKELGFVSACLEKPYCRHIGTHSSTPLSNQ